MKATPIHVVLAQHGEHVLTYDMSLDKVGYANMRTDEIIAPGSAIYRLYSPHWQQTKVHGKFIAECLEKIRQNFYFIQDNQTIFVMEKAYINKAQCDIPTQIILKAADYFTPLFKSLNWTTTRYKKLGDYNDN